MVISIEASTGGTHDTKAVYEAKSAQQESAVLHRDLNLELLELARGEGNHLILSDGRRIFDASGGAAVACVGVSRLPSYSLEYVTVS